MKKDARVDRK